MKLLTADGTLQMMNRAGLKMIEADSLDEVKGQCVFPLVAEEHREAFKVLLEDVFEGRSGSLEFKAIGLKGRPVWLYSHAVPLRNEKGDIISMLSTTIDITDRKMMEQSLQRSEEKYRSVIENIGIGIAMISPDMKIISLNKQMKEWFPHIDVSAGPLCYQAFNDPPGRGICEYCPTALTLKDGELHDAITNTPAGDRIINFRIKSSPVKDADGRIIAAIEMVDDITERQQTENALRLGESRLKHAQQIAHVGDWEWEIQSGRVHWSDELYRIYGYKPHEIAPDYALVVKSMHPESREKFLGAIDGALRGARPFEMDYLFFRKDGSEAALHTIGRVVLDKNGAPERMVGIVQDITEQRRAAEALRESEEKFRSVFDNASDGILIANISTREFIEANKTICTMTGYSREELTSLRIDDLHPERDLPHALGEFEKQMKGEKVIAEELPVERKDGGIFYADVCAAAITVRGERYAVGIFRDITARKKTEEGMKAALAEKEILLKEIHHRVKNNLQIVASMLRLQSGQIRDKEARTVFEESRNRIQAMALIHERLYRSENLALIEFKEYVEELTADVFSLAPGHAQHIEKSIDIEKVTLEVNLAIPCGLIINELVSNSLLHAFPGGRSGVIEIRMYSDNEKKTILQVRDNGVGFPESANLVHSKTLGLQLVISLVKQLNGTITLDRTEGTDIRISF